MEKEVRDFYQRWTEVTMMILIEIAEELRTTGYFYPDGRGRV